MALARHEPPRLRRNLSWSFVGNVTYAAAQWAMLVVLAKMGTPDMVGQFALGLAVTAPVIVFSNLELRAVQATDATGHYRFGDYLTLRLITATLALVVILGIVCATGYRGEKALVVMVVGLAKVFESISDVFYGLFLRHEHVDLMAKSMLIKAPLSLAGLTLGVYLTDSAVGGAFGMAIVWALILFGYDVRNGVQILRAPHRATLGLMPGDNDPDTKPQPHKTMSNLGHLVRLTLPLGLVGMLVNFYPNIPRYFVEGYLGAGQLGIFAAMSYTALAGVKLVDSMAQSVGPRLARYHVAGNAVHFRTVLFKAAGIGFMLGAAGVLTALIAGTEILTLFYGPEYAAHPEVFVWLVIAGGMDCVASFLYWAITAARRFAIQIPLFALVACTSTAASFWLVPASGLQGAAVASVLAAMVRLVGALAIVVHVINTARSGVNIQSGPR